MPQARSLVAPSILIFLVAIVLLATSHTTLEKVGSLSTVLGLSLIVGGTYRIIDLREREGTLSVGRHGLWATGNYAFVLLGILCTLGGFYLYLGGSLPSLFQS